MNKAPTTRIYVVNDAGHRYDLALGLVENGKLIPLTVGDVNPTQVDRLSFLLTQQIARSSPKDYLLLSGTPVLNAIAAALWILRHSEMRLLIFDAKIQGYVEKIVTRHNYQAMIDRELFS